MIILTSQTTGAKRELTDLRCVRTMSDRWLQGKTNESGLVEMQLVDVIEVTLHDDPDIYTGHLHTC